MTRYLGNIPVVGKDNVEAFNCYCEICQKEKSFHWVKPYGNTIIRNVIDRLFFLQRGLTPKGIMYSFHTKLVIFKIKNVVEIGECEQCGLKKVKCRHCGHITDFDEWQEVYQCPQCHKESYMLAAHPQPWHGLTIKINDDEE